MENISQSVLAKLKNLSKANKVPLQQLLNLFCQEEFIRRLSISNYKNNLILKGGYFLYSISEFTSRPTIDTDYLLSGYSNNLNAIKNLITNVISVEPRNDFVKMQIKNLLIISKFNEYHGVRANLIGSIGRTQTPFSLDFGVGDIIFPSWIERTLPVLLSGFEQPKILTYSLESIVAEKLDAIITLMNMTGRMKDFYDIYYLAINYNFEGNHLQKAIYQTLSNRKRVFDENSITDIGILIDDNEFLLRWEDFCKGVLRFDLSFESVAYLIIDFLSSPYNAIIAKRVFLKKWDNKHRTYY